MEIKKGDWVSVKDEGLEMMAKFAPKDSNPQNIGIVNDVLDNGELEIWFPIGDDKMSEHSQASIYMKSQCTKIKKPNWIKD